MRLISGLHAASVVPGVMNAETILNQERLATTPLFSVSPEQWHEMRVVPAMALEADLKLKKILFVAGGLTVLWLVLRGR